MHAANVVHRDLKPENLLLVSGRSIFNIYAVLPLRMFTVTCFTEEDDTSIKIADFGFAKRISDLQPQETACGTPGYVAPEILRGDAYGPEVDIWSMGVICYVLLAGYPPFYDEDQKKLFKKIKEGRYYFHEDYWSNVSEDAMDLIRKMLCVNQTERWTATQLLSHPWITAGDETLASKNLSQALVEMKRFNARRRFKSAADAIIVTNRIKRLVGAKDSLGDDKEGGFEGDDSKDDLAGQAEEK